MLYWLYTDVILSDKIAIDDYKVIILVLLSYVKSYNTDFTLWAMRQPRKHYRQGMLELTFTTERSEKRVWRTAGEKAFCRRWHRNGWLFSCVGKRWGNSKGGRVEDHFRDARDVMPQGKLAILYFHVREKNENFINWVLDIQGSFLWKKNGWLETGV